MYVNIYFFKGEWMNFLNIMYANPFLSAQRKNDLTVIENVHISKIF